jgi:hypothetical protein
MNLLRRVGCFIRWEVFSGWILNGNPRRILGVPTSRMRRGRCGFHLKCMASALGILGSLFGGPCFAAGSLPTDPAFDMSAADTHWAFVSLEKPEIPLVGGSSARGAVDAFISSKLRERGLSLNTRADKRTLIRRVTYDLTGLPPTYEEVEKFLLDESSDAYVRLVDRLLASDAYGERWARHWLDVARYADTKGIFRGGRYSFSYTYRDYVIGSFNEDKPYDRFILEQIAADQLGLEDNDPALAAMGFLTLGRTFFGRKDFIIDDQIDVVTRGVQALTVSCSRCHDHKFDPIPTADYYSLHGVFNSSQDAKELPVIRWPENDEDYQSFLKEQKRFDDEIAALTDKTIDKFLVSERSATGSYLDAVEEAKEIKAEDDFKVFAGSRKLQTDVLKLWISYLDSDEGKSHPLLRDWFREYENGDREKGVSDYNERFSLAAKEEGEQAIRAFFREQGTPLNPDREKIAKWIRRKIGADTGELTRERHALDWTHPGAPIRAHILEDVSKPKNSSIYKRGDSGNLGDEAPRQYLQVLSGKNRTPFSLGSGRLQLAEAIVGESGQLTARVIANRIWSWHMGTGIVDTPSDFGVRTLEPEHIDLLNWMASSLIESGWSIKSLNRLIVLSDTYQQSSAPSSEGLSIDSENVLWHYFPRTRLDFESMRDTLLLVAGNLDQTTGGIQVDITDPLTNRRTVYGFIDRKDMPGIFRTFDHPSPEASSPGRFETLVPQQALFLMNSPFVIEQSKRLAERVGGYSRFEERIKQLYRNVYQRDPITSELQNGLQFVHEFRREKDSAIAAGQIDEKNDEVIEPLNEWELYAQALLASNELMFVD